MIVSILIQTTDNLGVPIEHAIRTLLFHTHFFLQFSAVGFCPRSTTETGSEAELFSAK